MAQINDAEFATLRGKGYVGALDDMRWQQFRAVGGERAYWMTLAPNAIGALNDIKREALRLAGYPDNELGFWLNGGGLVLGPITNRTGLLTDDGGASNTDVLTETPMVVFDNVTYIEFEYPNWRTAPTGSALGGAVEVGLASPATGTAQITYLDATTGVMTTVNLLDKTTGTTALTAPAGGDFVCYANINAPRGSRIFPRFRGNFPGGMPFAQKRADLANGDAFQFGSSVPPLSTKPIQSFDLAWYGPSSVRGYTTRDTVAIIGDSRDTGITDVANTALGNIGQWPRLLAARLACINISVPGDTAADFVITAQNPRRRRLAGYAKRVAIGLGVNDMVFNNRTAAQVQADVQAIATSLGKPAMYKAIDPVSNGGATTPNFPAKEVHRLGYNTWVRTQPVFFDPPAVLESVANPGSWADASYQIDNTHESNIGNALAASSGATFNWSTIGNPAVLTQAPWLPTILGSNLLSWHKKDTATVAQWTDATANAKHFVQATGANQPTVHASGGLTFADATKFMDCAGIDSGLMNEGIVAACTVAENTTNKQILGAQGGTGNGRQFIYQSNGFVWLNRQGNAALAAKAYSAGKQIATTLVTPIRSGCRIGVNGGALDVAGGTEASMTGSQTTRMGGVGTLSIHEVVRFHSENTALSDVQRVEGYVAWNNGTQAALDAAHPYKNGIPTA